jgi:HEAT repeat protein
MAKRSNVEAELSELVALGKDPSRPDMVEKLRKALGSTLSFIVAKAATVVAQHKQTSLQSDLIAAFDRYLNDPKYNDKGCEAKTAIAKTLYEFGDPVAAPVFLRGIKVFQISRGFGTPTDPAAELRGISALGLVRIAHRDVMRLLVDLLDDPIPQARMFAARALAYSERDEAALLLRFKLLVGDAEPEVMSECMSALVRFRSQPDLAEFIGRFLDNEDPNLRTSAALSLGESRLASALDVLRDHLHREDDADVRQSIVLAAATLRLPQALDWLIHLIERGSIEHATLAVEALGLYRREEAIATRVRDAANARAATEVDKAVAKFFGI